MNVLSCDGNLQEILEAEYFGFNCFEIQ